MANSGIKQRLAAILAADVAGYTRLMADDEAATIAALNECRALFRQAIESNDGRVVDMAGDSVLAVFATTTGAAMSAVGAQDRIEEISADIPDERQMLFRVGLNLGDIHEQDDGTIYGDGVNVAARLQSLAAPGGICVSDKVYSELRNRLDLAFEDIGEHEVKNIADPVRVFRVIPGGSPAHRPKKAHNWKRPAIVAAAVLAIISVGLAIWQPGTQSPQPAIQTIVDEADPSLAMPEGPSIAVLPFTNMTGDQEQQFFTDGMTEELITELTRFRELLVFGSNTTFSYKDRLVDPRQVHQDLGADYALGGSIRRAGETLRVTAQLTNAATGATIWGETYERVLSAANVFEVQDEITNAVVTTIAQTHGVIHTTELERSARRPPEDIGAYDCVLRTLEFYRHLDYNQHAPVRDCLEAAVTQEPDYAKAWAWLAIVYVDEYRFGWNPRPDPLARARDAADRSIKLDPRDGTAHMLSATTSLFERDLDRFNQDVDRALQLSPNDSYTLAWLAEQVSIAGQFERGAAMINKARRMNPEHPGWYHWPLWRFNYANGNYSSALDHVDQFNSPGHYWTHGVRALCLAGLGRLEEGRAAVDEAIRLKPDFVENFYQDITNFAWTPEARVIADKGIDGMRTLGYAIDRGSH